MDLHDSGEPFAGCRRGRRTTRISAAGCRVAAIEVHGALVCPEASFLPQERAGCVNQLDPHPRRTALRSQKHRQGAQRHSRARPLRASESHRHCPAAPIALALLNPNSVRIVHFGVESMAALPDVRTFGQPHVLKRFLASRSELRGMCRARSGEHDDAETGVSIREDSSQRSGHSLPGSSPSSGAAAPLPTLVCTLKISLA